MFVSSGPFSAPTHASPLGFGFVYQFGFLYFTAALYSFGLAGPVNS
jgi:hypothetical protein